MSASSKKKLRAEEASAKLTEKQLAEQKEAKKVKAYTIAFVAVLVILLVVAIVAGVSKTISGSGMRERNTTAVTVGNHAISNAELNYFFIDAVNNFYSQNGAYAELMGLDLTKPLDQQMIDEESGMTWADNFIEAAKSNARTVYALVDDAEANGFTLTEEQQAQIDNLENNMQLYATMAGASDVQTYLKAYYGNGARMDTFKAYNAHAVLANAYQAHHTESLVYSDAELRAKDAENPAAFNSYTFNQYYLSTNQFLTGGTAAEDGSMTYSDAEKSAAEKAAEAAAKSLVGDNITSVETFDAAIAALDVNAGSNAKSTAYTNLLYSAVSSKVADWIGDASRKEGDKTYIASTISSTDENGNETTSVGGYYVVYFISSNDNKTDLVNVRHILVNFEGESGADGYSAETKQAAKDAAQAILDEWKAGDATEESFGALAMQYTDDGGSRTTGGLYENVYPGQMVPSFNDWCFDSSRKAGDTGLVESEYGYHVMYFCGKAPLNYRDFLISDNLRTVDEENWFNELIEKTPVVDGDTSYMSTAIVLNSKG